LFQTHRLEKNPLPLPGIEPRSSSVYSDSILPELPQLPLIMCEMGFKLKISISWGVAQCSLAENDRRFRGIYRYTILIRNSENRKAPKTESFFMEVVCTPKLAFGPNMPRHDTRSTHTRQVCCVQALETRPGVAPSWLRQSRLSAPTSVGQQGVMCLYCMYMYSCIA
jgi:hypothetical protein